ASAPEEEVEAGGGGRGAAADGLDLDLDPSPACPHLEAEHVPPIAVDVHLVGVEVTDTQAGTTHFRYGTGRPDASHPGVHSHLQRSPPRPAAHRRDPERSPPGRGPGDR